MKLLLVMLPMVFEVKHLDVNVTERCVFADVSSFGVTTDINTRAQEYSCWKCLLPA